jgi:hypothetical protein
MPTILNWWCGLFGYGGCGAVSVFEALILLPVTALALTAAAAAVFWALGGAPLPALHCRPFHVRVEDPTKVTRELVGRPAAETP